MRLATTQLSPIIRRRLDALRPQMQSRRTQALALSALSLIVVLLVVVVLHMRVLAQTHEVRMLDCPVASGVGHVHDESCYDEEGGLICPLDEVDVHYHDEDCYDEEGNLVCGQEEGGDSHQHGPGCFKTMLVDDEGNVLGPAPTEESADDTEKVHYKADLRERAEDGEERVVVTVEADVPVDALPEGTKLYVDRLKEEKVDDVLAVDEAEVEEGKEGSSDEGGKKNDAAEAEDKKSDAAEAEDKGGNSSESEGEGDSQGASPEAALDAKVKADAALVEHASEKATEKVEDKAPGKVTDLLALDISFRDGEGKRIEPEKPLTVRVSSDIIAEDADPYVVRFDDKGDASFVTTLDADQLASRKIESKSDELVFETDRLVPCAVAIASTDQTLEASGGETYDSARLDAPASAGVPRGSELHISELKDDAEGYDEYLAQAREAVGDDAAEVLLYDISIAHDAAEVQPQATVDVTLNLTEEVAEHFENVGVLHFGAEGPESLDAYKDGQAVSFEAQSFSVYAIVDGLPAPIEGEDYGTIPVAGVDELAEYGQDGVYIAHLSGYYATNEQYTISGSRTGIKKTAATSSLDTAITRGAVPYYFERVGGEGSNQFRLYCLSADDTPQYVRQNGNALSLVAKNQATTFKVEEHPNGGYRIVGASNYCWNMQGGTTGNGFAAYNNLTDGNAAFKFERHVDQPDDPFELDGQTFGIVYRNGEVNAFGALSTTKTISNKSVLSVEALTLRPNVTESGGYMVVSEDSDIAEWTFVSVSGAQYLLTTQVDGQTKYLTIRGNAGVTLEDQPYADGSIITVSAGKDANEGKYQFRVGNTALNLTSLSANGGFGTSTGSGTTTWMNLVRKTDLSDDDFVKYQARKVNLSDRNEVPDGAQVVIYARVWDEDEKRYKYYVVNHDGALLPVHASGDMLEWIGGSINTVTWSFTEYLGENGQPSFYYELQNEYSGKYLAPQLSGQITQDGPIGLNINGRRYGEDNSTIVAWDDPYYDYAALHVDTSNGVKVVPSPFAQADDFYFAMIMPATDDLTEVNTVDNDEHGITMKMVDYDYGTVRDSGETREQSQYDVLGVTGGNKPNPTYDMLNPYLDDNGYPMTNGAITQKDSVSLAELFANYQGKDGGTIRDVDHLFLEGTYNESGYFEFDSTQNFAHLNDDGTFTVYDQLAGIGHSGGATRQHGQFAPLNEIEAGKLSQLRNLTRVDQTPLDDTDPRKGEQLHLIETNQMNYYFGMELEASFIQTPSGLDAWGHDIIFEFSGDDDFWFYVDDCLAIDLGGVRQAASGNINFRTGEIHYYDRTTTLYEVIRNGYAAKHNLDPNSAEVQAYLDDTFTVVDGNHVFKEYTTHTMKMFYMERGAGASNLHMRFNLASAKPNTVVLNKQISGTEHADYALAEFPYQIYYRDPDSEEANYLLLPKEQWVVDRMVPSVTYTDRAVPVKYADSFTPTGGTDAYHNVFFLKPGQSADIRLPDGVTEYYIKECGVSESIYDVVKANGTPRTGEPSGNTGRSDYRINPTTLADTPRVTYDNHVNPNALRTLSITKRLYNVDGSEITNDPTGFALRLYLADEEGEPQLANMQPYSVKAPDGRYCTWNKDNQQFEPLAGAGKDRWDGLSDEEKAAVVFYTSINGSISRIPARYTVEVRELIVGTKFMVEEFERDIPSGYAFKEYARVGGSYISGESDNSGTIRDNSDPAIEVHNVKGWGLTAEKAWSDKDYMSAHDPIYFAVYIGDALVEDSVRQLANGKTSSYWFFSDLEVGKGFSDYKVREVTLVGSFDAAQDVSDKGVVTLHDGVTVTPIDNNGSLTVGATPTGGSAGSYTYGVTYEQGEPTGAAAGEENVRTDTVRNTRDGIKIYKRDSNGNALEGAVFTLTDENDAPVGAASYTSDSEGFVTNAYLPNGSYRLTETSVPSGYHALEGPLTIAVSNGVPTLSGDDAVVALCTYDADAKTITVRNKGFQLQMRKKGVGNADLPDTHFALYRQVHDASGAPRPDYSPMGGYEDLVSDAQGVIPQLDATLAPGAYYLRETQAADGYKVLGRDLCFEVTKTGTMAITGDAAWSLAVDGTTDANVVAYTVTILNELNAQKVELHKVDDAGHDLSGATFELLLWEGAGAPDSAGGGTWTKVQDGIKPGDAASSTANPVMLGTDPMGLSVGSYRLREVGTPDGYVVLDGKTDFSVAYDDQESKLVARLATGTDASITCVPRTEQDGTVVYTLTIPNTPGAELPHSGGTGTTVFYAVGAVLAAAGALHFARQWREGR